MKIEDLKSRKIAILGVGQEGKSTFQFLKTIGAIDITLLDKDIESIESMDTDGAVCIAGASYLDSLSSFDIIFKSPGVCPYDGKLSPYRDKFTSQTQVFFENYTGKVIAVTGTKGKSTVSTLTYLTLKEAGYKVKLVGNIGTPVLEEINIIPNSNNEIYDFVVYEMSSYMLDGFTPQNYISLIVNISPCHLDWHKSYENYLQAKLHITEKSNYILSLSDLKNSIGERLPKHTLYFGNEGNYIYQDKRFSKESIELFKDENILLEGEHNRRNICAIIGICDILNIPLEKLKNVLSTFSGLPHRIENIGNYHGITFINDSMATTPESTIAAIETFGNSIGTLIIGGYDSGFEFDTLKFTIEKYKIPNIVFLPDTGYKIFEQALQGVTEEKEIQIDLGYGEINVLKTRYMKQAVHFAYQYSGNQKICLLSCAAPSYTLWKNYKERADDFIQNVRDLGTENK